MSDLESQPLEGGDSLPERTDDFPPGDLWHAGQDIAALVPDLATRADEIGVPADPNRWERLDVARAAAYVQQTNPDAFRLVAEGHPWLRNDADETDTGAAGALADQF